MLIPLLMSLLANSPEPVVTPPLPFPIVQDDGEIEDKRPLIKEKLEAFKEHIGKRGDQDAEAIAIMDSMIQEWPMCGPKDRGSITKALGKCFDQKRQELSEGIPNNRLYLAAAVALGEMGEFASPILTKCIDNKKHRRNLPLRRTLVLSLGKTKDLDVVDDLVDLINDKDYIIVASTAEALGEFKEAPEKVRKEIFNELMKILVTLKAIKDGDINDIAAREKWDVVSAPIITTLQDLSGHDETQPEAWQHWWNKNKKKDWE
ncbi:MAG: hypothetical protein ACI8X5_000854 [Planctomycetota bacterium]|jgi:hypothetical protein